MSEPSVRPRRNRRKAASSNGNGARQPGYGRPWPRRWCRRSPTPTCRSARGATRSPRRSATTRWSSSPARPARARPPSCPRSASSSAAASRGQIGHTQPRRIAARTVAERIADELQVAARRRRRLQGAVHRPGRATGTLVKLMTDGILLAEIQRDRLLRRYDTIIIDEAHERSLNIDFLLGYLHRLLPRRPDLKVDRHLGDDRPAALRRALRRRPRRSSRCPAAPTRSRSATARTAPTTSRRPRPGAGDRRRRRRAARAEGPGDVLVFLSGEREIRDTADALRGDAGPRRHRGAAALRAAVDRRAAAGLRAAHRRAASCSRPTSPRPR